MAAKTSFLDALDKATQADLDAVNAEIDELQKVLEKRTAQRKMLQILLGVVVTKKPGPKKPKATPADDDDDDDEIPQHGANMSKDSHGYERRQRIASLLLSGPKSIDELRAAVGAPVQGFLSTLRCPWFNVMTGGIVHITSAGRAAATGKPQTA